MQVLLWKISKRGQELEVCSFDVKSKEEELYANLLKQEMIKRCDTHYQTKCSKACHGGYPKCHQMSVQVRHVKKVVRCCFDKVRRIPAMCPC